MKKFLQKLDAREPHEKREFAAYAAAGVTGLVAIVWLSTLGSRLANSGGSPTVAGSDAAGLMAATAQAGAAFQDQLQNVGTGASAQASSSAPAAPAAAPATVIGSPNDPATAISQ